MNVGDYVRTPQGIIAKIINIQEDTGQYFLNGNAVSLESKNYIADKNITIGENFKHSPNIIDLIEVGDYVNGCKVTYVAGTRYDDNDLHCWCDECWNREKQCLVGIPAKNIKTIVTHEQMEAMKYRVEE